MKKGIYIHDEGNLERLLDFLVASGGILVNPSSSPPPGLWWGFGDTGADKNEIRWSRDEDFWISKGFQKFIYSKITEKFYNSEDTMILHIPHGWEGEIILHRDEN